MRILLIFFMLQALPASASSALVKTILLQVDQSKLLELDGNIQDVFLANPELAMVHTPSTRSVLVYGKKMGSTDLIVVGSDEQTLAHFRIKVAADITPLTQQAKQRFPHLTLDFKVEEGLVIVSGEVDNPLQAHEVLSMVQGFAKGLFNDSLGATLGTSAPVQAVEGSAVPGGGSGEYQNVLNQLTLSGSDQINISIRIIEMQRATSEQLGLRWSAVGEYLELGVSPGNQFGNAMASANGVKKKNINAIVDALVENSLVSVLAEPNLTAKSGEAATFMSGGEFPFPVDNGDDGVSIEFKKFGISLELTPTLMSNKRISLTVSPEVSTLSREHSVSIAGVEVPGIEARRTTTTIELADGQSFALAGLIRTYRDHKVESLPFLGEIPYLSPLFSTNSYQNSESELVIIATARLVEPTSAANLLRSPLDEFRPASRFERLFFGKQGDFSNAPTRVFGDYGYEF
ncbi:type II and III secretion system protein family protein [Motilimonas cestriensis]|uniref:type II and III secretion system protein family protein n=1 Tax=Motilimonas cestriensis TaxID=2742685 RepID=UPI003DA6BEEC